MRDSVLFGTGAMACSGVGVTFTVGSGMMWVVIWGAMSGLYVSQRRVGFRVNFLSLSCLFIPSPSNPYSLAGQITDLFP